MHTLAKVSLVVLLTGACRTAGPEPVDRAAEPVERPTSAPIEAPAPGSAPAPAIDAPPAPVEAVPPAPEVEPGLSCADLNGAFDSVTRLECGRGGARCHWRLTFSGVTFRWRYSDVASSGSFTCAGGVVSASTRGRTLEGRLDGDALVWRGERYRPATAAPPIPAPAVSPKPPVLGTLARDAEHARGCTADRDCRVTTLRDGDCCEAACGPSMSYNAAFLRELTAHHQATCAPQLSECPAVACAREAYHPVCRRGRCAAVPGAF